MLNNDLLAKQLELLHEAVPQASTIGLLINPHSPIAEQVSKEAQVAVRALGQQLHMVKAVSESEFEPAFATLVQLRVDALCIHGDIVFNSRAEQLVKLAARHAIPAVYAFRDYTAAGGLMSYGSSLTKAYRQAGIYTGRILNGDKPADLPVQEAVKVELIINLNTAKALGLEIPGSVLARADEVIE